jgi:hypothetical protein
MNTAFCVLADMLLRTSDNAPVIVLCDDVVAACRARRRGELDPLEIPDVFLRRFLVALGLVVLAIWWVSIRMRALLFRIWRDCQFIECAIELCWRLTDLLTIHLDAHISDTRHHFTGAPDPSEPPYAPSYHPPTGYWTSTEKARFFHALSTHSRFRPDLIASSIGTKSQLDVIVYLDLLRDGAQELTAIRGAIARDQLPAAYEVSDALVELEDAHAARLAATEPTRTDKSCAAARAEAQRAMRNSMRVRKGEGTKGAERDRAGQQARREEFGKWCEEREGVWAREDVLARLDDVALQALDRMLRVDEEGGIPPSTDRPAPSPADDSEDVDALANLSPASRRRTYKRLYMRRKRAEASGGVAQLDPTRLKPGRKATAPNQRRPSADDSTDDDADPGDDARRLHGTTRPYKVQRKLDELGIGAEYMRENGLGLFRLGALWRLMRCVSHLPSHSTINGCSRPQTVSPPGPLAASRRHRVHLGSYDPNTTHARRAVHARHHTTRPRPARTRLCAARTRQDVASRQARRTSPTRQTRTTDARCVSR